MPDDFTRQWGTPWTGKGFNNVKNYVRINPLTAEWALRALIDFTLSNARRFYSSMGNPLEGKGLRILFFFFKFKKWYHSHENKFRCFKRRKFEYCEYCNILEKTLLLRKCENMLQEWNSIFYQLLTEIQFKELLIFLHCLWQKQYWLNLYKVFNLTFSKISHLKLVNL